MDTTPAQDSIRAFLGYLKRRGRSPMTPVKYGRFLTLFEQWAGDRQIGAITAAEIEMDYLAEWFESFEQRRGKAPSPSTVKNHIQALRALYAFADRFDLLKDDDGNRARNPMTQIEMPRIKQQVKEWLTPDEYEQLLTATATDDERFLVAWLGMTAMRIGETSTPWANVDLSTHPGSILIRASKTDGGIRRITMSSELRLHVQAHLKRQRERGLADSDCPVLCTKFGNPVLEQQANRTLKRIARRAGITKNVTNHCLRRSWAMAALAHGMSVESVADHLGHENVATTQTHYARIQHSQVEAEVIKAFG